MKSFILFALLAPLASGQNPNTAVYPGRVATDADLLVAANNARSTLSGAITSGATSLTLADASKFRTPGAITIENEIVFCSAKSSNTFSGCTRGVEGTTAASHSSGVTAQGNFIAYHHNQLAAEVKAIESAMGSSSYGTVVPYSGNHTITSTDCRNWITESAAATVTLPNPPISTTCAFALQNISTSGTVTLSHNGLNINGQAADYSIAPCAGIICQSISVWTDGSNYFASAGPKGATGATGSGAGFTRVHFAGSFIGNSYWPAGPFYISSTSTANNGTNVIGNGNSSGFTGATLGATGPSYLQIIVPVPDGWGGSLTLRSFFTLRNFGSGTGSHSYSVACVTPATSNFYSAYSFAAAATVAFTFTGSMYQTGQLDAPTLTLPTCAARDEMIIRMTRNVTGTSTDDTLAAYFDYLLQ